MSLLTDEEILSMDYRGTTDEALRYARVVEAAVLKRLGEQEPVAIVGDVYQLLWFGSSPIAAITSKHGIKVGDKLYTHPAPPKAEWISVDDRLPESRDEMLCLFVKDSGKTYVGTSSLNPAKTGFYVEYSFDEPIERVTHWQPLPAPPEAK